MGFLPDTQPIHILNQIRKMLVGLVRSIDHKPVTRHPSPVTTS
jgi:hypothetical protein